VLLPRLRGKLMYSVAVLIVTVSATMVVVLGQLDVYRWITGVQKPIDEDVFVFATLLIENLSAIGILFFLLKRERNMSIR
jgi:hypothetical protein